MSNYNFKLWNRLTIHSNYNKKIKCPKHNMNNKTII